MSGQEQVLQVVIFRDGSLLGNEVFPPGAYRIGSAHGNELRLEHPSVDHQHAVLYFQNGKAVIQDSSRAGLFVNGQRVSVKEVKPIDEVRCGPFVLKARVVLQPASPGAPPPEVEALLKGGPAAVRSAPRPASSVAPAAKPERVIANAAPAAPVDSRTRRPPTAAAIPMAEARAQPVRGVAVPQARPVNSNAGQKPDPWEQLVEESFVEEAGPAVKHTSSDGAQRGIPRVPAARARAPGAPAPVARAPAPQPREPALRAPVPIPHTPEPAPHAPLSKHRARGSAPEALAPRRRKTRSERTGPPVLNFELFWGDARRAACSFGASKKPVIASDSENAQLPLWGFTLPNHPFAIAQSVGQEFRLYLPPRARIEKRKPDGRFYPLAPKELEADGTGRFLLLSDGMEARLVEGSMWLWAYVAPRPPRVWPNPFRGLPWTVLFLITLFGSGLLYFLLYGPRPPEGADFVARKLAPVAVRLITPPPPKKEEPKKEEEKPKELVPEAKPEKQVVKVERRRPARQKTPKQVVVEKAPEPPPESKALKALAKLSAAGPATGDILAAVDKLGSGPGSKKSKSNYKLSGLIGKAPIANAGLGTFGLGGGGKGGGTILGSEVLRGKGGGGIGALGLRGIGKGTVAGTVTRASARTVSVQGSVDREAVAKTVNAHLQEVRACYEKALIKEPALAGKVVLEWTISLSGTVVTAKIKTSTLRNGAVEGCILTDLKTWKFPPAKGGLVIVSYPFLFNSVGY